MTGDRIVAVGLLTAADVALLGQGFRRLFPVPRDGDFGALLDALDRVEINEEADVEPDATTKPGDAASPSPADEPSSVEVADGQVLVDGPGGVAITFTPHAARETGRRLGRASDAAEAQQSDLKR